MTIVVDIGGADVLVPRHNIADTHQSKYVPTIHGAKIKGGARRPAEPYWAGTAMPSP